MNTIKNLLNKKILLFAPQGKGIYGSAIYKELENKGAKVFIYNERPSTSSLIKLLYRIAKPLLKYHFSKYIDKVLNDVKNIEFDYVLIIRGEAFNVNQVKKLRKHSPNVKVILYLWDSFRNNDVRSILPYFDRTLSFDMEDCKNQNNLIFRPLFYIEEYEQIANNRNFDNDVVFVGTIHTERLMLLNKMKLFLNKLGLKSLIYMYFPSRLLFLKKRFSDKNFKESKISDFNYKLIPSIEVAKMIERSKVSIDMQAPTQTGLTMRTIEILGAKRKLITTNKQIEAYDFYNEKNIQIINDNFDSIDLDFFNNSYAELPLEIYKKYALRNWIDVVLDL